MVVFADIKDFFLYLNWHAEGAILRAGFLIDQSFFSKLIIGISPTVKNSP